MQRLVEAELVFRRGTPPDATYLFKHALVRDAAYESLLKAKRAAMHARLVDVLERSGTRLPEVKAQHAEAGGLTERALGYWEQAGTRALARPAYREAIAQLENAVRLCRAMGGDRRWRRREQGLHLQLGQALIANQGYQAAGDAAAFEHALGLADEIGDVSLAAAGPVRAVGRPPHRRHGLGRSRPALRRAGRDAVRGRVRASSACACSAWSASTRAALRNRSR